MDLIDWVGVAKNALWILGLAIMLAAFSYADWWAATNHARLRTVLGAPIFQTPFNLGLTLFAAGLASTSRTWWEIGAWIVLGLLFAWQTIASWRSRAPAAAPPAMPPERPADSPDA